MAQAAALPASTPVTIPLHEILPWATFLGVALMSLLYLVGMEQGATSLIPGTVLHEFLHDGRHLLGFPCH